MRWTDIYDIAVSLSESHPEVDPKQVNFVDLRDWILDLDGFDDDPKRCGERILEGIQMAWIDELS
jgi:FeS assembly protein IscX